MEEEINKIQSEYSEKISLAKSLKELDEIFLELFGKKGELTLLPKEFPALSVGVRKKVGPVFNELKLKLEKEINDKREEIREEGYKKLDLEKLELDSGPFGGTQGKQARMTKERKGHLHPLTQFEKQIADLFGKLGFQQYDGPQIDTDINNFQLLNIPKDHPSRDLQDTLYLSNNLLLRTHTSNSQIHIMKKYKPPIRMMVIGRCFRHENLDPRHEHTFDQFELIYVDKGVNMTHLQYLSEYFLKGILDENIKARLSPGYYPFTEPSAHIFGTCVFCKGSGCKICADTGELELAGAGMIHPKVLKQCGIDPEFYSGIAWGVGPARMAMLKYGIEDIRLFNSGNLKFLQKY